MTLGSGSKGPIDSLPLRSSTVWGRLMAREVWATLGNGVTPGCLCWGPCRDTTRFSFSPSGSACARGHDVTKDGPLFLRIIDKKQKKYKRSIQGMAKPSPWGRKGIPRSQLRKRPGGGQQRRSQWSPQSHSTFHFKVSHRVFADTPRTMFNRIPPTGRLRPSRV